jgi:hypothetical protein
LIAGSFLPIGLPVIIETFARDSGHAPYRRASPGLFEFCQRKYFIMGLSICVMVRAEDTRIKESPIAREFDLAVTKVGRPGFLPLEDLSRSAPPTGTDSDVHA